MGKMSELAMNGAILPDELNEQDGVIAINYDRGEPTVSGRELHDALGIETRYNDWFRRMCECGFEEGKDFYSFLSKTSNGGRPATEHAITISMAKELCMIQHNEISRQFRKYFIKIEENWNKPEAVFARAVQLANETMEEIKRQNRFLIEDNAIKTQQIAEMQPKATYYDVVLACKDLVPITLIAKDYGWSGKKMNKFLAEQKVQYKQGSTWLLYQKYADKKYTQSKTYLYNDNGVEHSKMNTLWTQNGRLFIYELMKKNGHLPVVEQSQEEETVNR